MWSFWSTPSNKIDRLFEEPLQAAPSRYFEEPDKQIIAGVELKGHDFHGGVHEQGFPGLGPILPQGLGSIHWPGWAPDPDLCLGVRHGPGRVYDTSRSLRLNLSADR